MCTCAGKKGGRGVNEDEGDTADTINSWYITAQKIIIWEKKPGNTWK